MIWLVAAAWAAPDAAAPVLGGYVGLWGLDPSKSDDPSQAFAIAKTTSGTTSTAAARYSPDGQSGFGSDNGTGATAQPDPDEARKSAFDDAMSLLAASGGIEVRLAGDEVVVTWTSEAPITVPLTRRYVKVDREPNERWRVRAWMDGANLVLERRQRSTSVAETFLPHERADEVVVVVWIEGASIAQPIEFRRIYRSIGPS